MERLIFSLLFVLLSCSILKCEIPDSVKTDTLKIMDSTEVIDSAKSISQKLYEKFDTADVGTNAENIEDALNCLYKFSKNLRLGVGYGYHYENKEYTYPNTSGYLWNISLETMLDKKKLWSFEIELYRYIFKKSNSESIMSRPGPYYIGTIVFKRYFPYFGKNIRPAIFAGTAPILIFGVLVGLDVDIIINKMFIVRAGCEKVWRAAWSHGGVPSAHDYSPYIANLKICFIPDF